MDQNELIDLFREVGVENKCRDGIVLIITKQ